MSFIETERRMLVVEFASEAYTNTPAISAASYTINIGVLERLAK